MRERCHSFCWSNNIFQLKYLYLLHLPCKLKYKLTRQSRSRHEVTLEPHTIENICGKRTEMQFLNFIQLYRNVMNRFIMQSLKLNADKKYYTNTIEFDYV